MQQNSDMQTKLHPNAEKYTHSALQYVVGDASIVANMETVQPLVPFSDCVLDFFNDLSKTLLKNGREYSDVVTFGFWCRKAALLREKGKYDDLGNRLGKGVVFHSTPSNVPVNFAFSFAAGLLAGNANIVRIPGKPFAQVELICATVKELLETSHPEMRPYIAFIKYPPVKEITDALCSIANTRVVWGGDGTIAEMRQSPLRPRANEITFADRHSIAVIDADGYLALPGKEKIAQDFYNDTYFSDQNACTAPRVIVWLGENKIQAKMEFWSRAHALVKEKYTLTPVQAVGKLAAFDRAANALDIRLMQDGTTNQDQYITRIQVDDLDDVMRFKYNSGFFFEYNAETIDEILPLCDERCQTLTYCGVKTEMLHNFMMRCRPRGVDRIVSMGKSMDFTLVWDGHDLVREMSRYIQYT